MQPGTSNVPLLLSLLSILGCIVTQAVGQYCEDDWFYMPRDNDAPGKCYFILGAPYQFDRASVRCQVSESGAQLASIATEEENNFIRRLFEDGNVTNPRSDYWIGLQKEDASLNNSWAWLDRTEFNWANWGSGQPANGEQCACLVIADNYQWSEKDCETSTGMICEMALTVPVTTTKSPSSGGISNTTAVYIGAGCMGAVVLSSLVTFCFVQRAKRKPRQPVAPTRGQQIY